MTSTRAGRQARIVELVTHRMVHSQTELVRYALRRGIIPLEN